MSPLSVLLLFVCTFTFLSVSFSQVVPVTVGGGGSGTSGGSGDSGSATSGINPIQICTPFFCPAIQHDVTAPNPKGETAHEFKIGILQSTSVVDNNAISLSKYAAYLINSNPDILINISVQVFSLSVAPGIPSMEAAAIALFEIPGINALILDTDEDGTMAIAQLCSAYTSALISMSSITQAFAKKADYPSFIRIDPGMKYATMAMVKVLLSLNKNTSIYIYTTDSYGNAAANDYIAQANAANISVFAVGLPATGSADDAIRQISTAVGVNWNVFVIAVNSNQLYRLYLYLNQSEYIGKDFLQIISPNVERAFASSAVQSTLMDGAISFLPTAVEMENPAFETFVEGWAQVPQDHFPGARPYPPSGFMAYDAAIALSMTAASMAAGFAPGSYPEFSTMDFVTKLRTVSFSGLTGDVTFDANGDRIGDYDIWNHIGTTPKLIGRWTEKTGEFALTQNFTFYNGSTVVPTLLNFTVNLTYFCSYTPPNTIVSTTSTIGTGGTTPPPEASSSSSEDDSTSIIIVPVDDGPQPIITGYIDPNNSSRCICDEGYGGDHCDKLVKVYKHKKLIPAISIALGVITLICFLIAVFAAVMLALFWENFRKHGSFYCGVIISGVFFAYAGAIVILPEQTPALCMLFPWFLGIGFTLVYGCLFIKTWTLYKVYRSAEQLKRTSLTPMSIIKGIGVYLAIEILILIIWTAVDRPSVTYHKMVDDTYILQCTAHPTFWAIFAGVKSLWLVFGAILSVLTRNITKEYSESKSIAYATYNIVALLVIGIPLALALRDIPGGLMIIEVCVILIAFTFTMCSLFFGIWLRIFGNEKSDMPSPYNGGSKRASSQTKSSGSKSSNERESPRSRSRSEHTNSSEMVIRI